MSFPGPPEADALVGAPIIVVLDVFVKILLYLLETLVHLPPESHTKELIQDRATKPLTNTIGLVHLGQITLPQGFIR